MVTGHSRLSLAQDIRTELIVDEKNRNTARGQALVVVFRNGLPAEGVSIKTPVGVFKTKPSGVLSFSAPAQRQSLYIPETDQTISFELVKDQETQITIHLLEKKAQAQVSAPVNNEDAKKVSEGPPQEIAFVVRSKGGKAISNASILFSGISTVFRTDASGRAAGQVPQGEYSLSVFHPEYQTLTMGDVKVAGQPLALTSIELKESVNELEDVVVLAPKVRGSVSALVEVRKQSSAVTDVLGSEQMSRAGDSDAAASLRRVTGLTLVGGKYVYVRGLGERYSGVLMNGFSLPSPEPSRRVVPLDLFPTAIMESIVVQKSYSPDLPGEFGGGLIQLKTKSLPEQFFFRANIAQNFENRSGGLSYNGGSTDWLGIDDGSREMPAIIKNALAQGLQLTPNIPGFDKGVSEAELAQMGRALANNYNTREYNEPSMPGIAMSTGNGWNFSGIQLGVAGSALYGQATDSLTRTARTFNVGSGGKLEADTITNTRYTEVETRLAGSFDVGMDFYKHTQIRASTFILRNTTNLTQNNLRQNFGSGGNFTDATTLDFTERQLWTQHLKGEHQLEKFIAHPIVFDWRVGRSQALRDSPDRREYSYDIINSNKTITSGSAGNRRTWSDLDDESTELALNLTAPVFKETPEYLKFKFGMWNVSKDRRSDITRMFFNGTAAGVGASASPEVQFDPENIGPGKYTLNNLTNAADTYSGTQNLTAQYAMADFSPFEKWSFQAGARYENSEQQVNTFKYFEPGNPFAMSSLKMRDVLPAYSVVWKPSDKIRARIAYSETLARPDFRELSTVGFIDDETGNNVQGNANLKGTVIKNIDHRWEYYFTPDEYASIGVFHKNFENPIEVMFLPGVNRIQTFDNAKAAENFGLELEGRVGVRHFSRTLRRFTVLTNLTLISSEIELDERNRGIQTSSSRPLQGQSPYVVNMQLQYDHSTLGFSTTLLYNVVGKRITEVGTNDIPDTYEQPFGQLDLVASKRIAKNYSINFRARNLLDPEVESTQANEIVRSQRRGRLFQVNLGAVF